MTLTQDRLIARLPHRPLRFYPQVESTNDLARNWLHEGASAGSVVIADEQLSGRGRLGRKWHTPPGVGLAVSVILRPKPANLPQITMLGALAIYDMLVNLGLPQVTIKWPNDVQVNGRKVSGVLAEAVWTGDQLAGVVLGMGINVRVDFTGTELADKAISIEPALGRPVDRADLAADLLAQVDKWQAGLGTVLLFETWKSRLATLGQPVSYAGFSGVAENVSPDGALMIRLADGRVQPVLAGDVAVENRRSI